MAYVTVPKDLSRVRSKVLFNLTKRQLICFGCGALAGVPLFFLCYTVHDADPFCMAMMWRKYIIPYVRVCIYYSA